MKTAIILFVRNPEPGKVKTRLAREIGNQAALRIYIQLLAHTHAITRDLPVDKFVFYAEAIGEADIWDTKQFFKRLQSGSDLGERMRDAFHQLFEAGYEKIIIVGSDCPSLTTNLIETAFSLLDTTPVVLGPAQDGGYYLLGKRLMIGELFTNKRWSTDAVLRDTLNDLTQKGIQYSLLPELQDIDTRDDLIRLDYPIPD